MSSWKEYHKLCCSIDKQKKMGQKKKKEKKNSKKLFYLWISKQFRADLLCGTQLFNFWSVIPLAFLVCSTLQIVKQHDTWHNSYRQCSHFRLLFRFKLRIKNAYELLQRFYCWHASMLQNGSGHLSLFRSCVSMTRILGV